MLNFSTGLGLVRLELNLGFKAGGIFPLVVAMPNAAQANYSNVVRALEAALPANALAEQSAGRRATALALTVAACFTKPSLEYLYGALLLVFVEARVRWRSPTTGRPKMRRHRQTREPVRAR